MLERRCKALNENGQPCRTPPLRGGDLCMWHDPAYEKQAAEARRAGGANHARELVLKSVYGLEGVTTMEGLQRMLDIATSGLLALDNTVARNRAMISAALAGAKLLETGELARQIENLQAVLEPRLPQKEKKGWFRR